MPRHELRRGAASAAAEAATRSMKSSVRVKTDVGQRFASSLCLPRENSFFRQQLFKQRKEKEKEEKKGGEKFHRRRFNRYYYRAQRPLTTGSCVINRPRNPCLQPLLIKCLINTTSGQLFTCNRTSFMILTRPWDHSSQ